MRSLGEIPGEIPGSDPEASPFFPNAWSWREITQHDVIAFLKGFAVGETIGASFIWG